MINNPKLKKYHDTWLEHHPNCVLVFWTDSDNNLLIETKYPQFLDTYKNLPIIIQKVDLVRLLYLHAFGGLYADLDYVAYANVLDRIRETAASQGKNTEDFLAVVKSPVILNEIMQNSLMFASKPGQEFWLKCVENIKEAFDFIRKNKPGVPGSICDKYEWGGCGLLNLFHNKITSRPLFILYTIYLTGPAMLDKTYVKEKDKNYPLVILPSEDFFLGKYCAHKQANTWINFKSLYKTAPVAFTVVSLFIAFIFIIIACVIGLSVLLYKAKRK